MNEILPTSSELLVRMSQKHDMAGVLVRTFERNTLSEKRVVRRLWREPPLFAVCSPASSEEIEGSIRLREEISGDQIIMELFQHPLKDWVSGNADIYIFTKPLVVIAAGIRRSLPALQVDLPGSLIIPSKVGDWALKIINECSVGAQTTALIKP